LADEVVPYSVEYYLGVVEDAGIHFDESDDESDDEKKPRKKSSTK